MVGPGRWRDEGPSNGTRGQSLAAQPAIGGRTVGHMQPSGITVYAPARSDGTRKLGITPRTGRPGG